MIYVFRWKLYEALSYAWCSAKISLNQTRLYRNLKHEVKCHVSHSKTWLLLLSFLCFCFLRKRTPSQAHLGRSHWPFPVGAAGQQLKAGSAGFSSGELKSVFSGAGGARRALARFSNTSAEAKKRKCAPEKNPRMGWAGE